jgi:hypothetical protein
MIAAWLARSLAVRTVAIAALGFARRVPRPIAVTAIAAPIAVPIAAAARPVVARVAAMHRAVTPHVL